MVQHKPKPLKASIWVGGTFLILVSAAIAFIMPQQGFLEHEPGDSALPGGQLAANAAASPDAPRVIGWKLLQTYDYKKQTIPPPLAEILGKNIKIPGFAVSLSTNLQAVEELLFVPNQLACIHVPAPPPHLVVYVKLRKAMAVDDLEGPLWMEGVLTLKHTDSVYGAAAYEMEALAVRPYTY